MISTVISWRDRNELSESIESLVNAVKLVSGELIIVNYSGNSYQLEEQLAAYRNLIRVITVTGETFFNKARCNNIGAFLSKHEYIFFCDCDIVLEEGTLRRLYKKVAQRSDAFATLSSVKESIRKPINGNHIVYFEYELTIKTANGRSLKIVNHEADPATGSRNAPGLLLVKKRDFEGVNGYNSNFHGWGWEDQDMISRLTLGANLKRIVHGNAIHLSHTDDARVKHYPNADRWESRDRIFRQALSNYNNNNFMGTMSSDIESFREKIIWPD